MFCHGMQASQAPYWCVLHIYLTINLKQYIMNTPQKTCKGELIYSHELEDSTEREPKSVYKCILCGTEKVNPTKSILEGSKYICHTPQQ